ncbi:hypothetical protein AB0P45_35445, partial [Streptomyces niveus]|uniref:hypothetical protein n=1 Tax=Streptomyces niveus TaxID=193462 RepID=UPI0034360D1A
MYGYDQNPGAQQQYAPPQQPMGAGGYGEQPLYPEPSPPSLADAVRAFTTGSLSAEDFQQIFATSKVYCPRGDNPGFLALHNTQQPVIPMFSTLKELRRYAGKESKYFVITGAEVHPGRMRLIQPQVHRAVVRHATPPGVRRYSIG